MKPKRLDTLITKKQLFQSREQAQRAIMAGEILVNDVRITKPGTRVSSDASIRYTGKTIPYVSRGGLKLKKAIDSFDLDFNDKVLIDIGSSTGGFTDCALKHGAKKVYAIDVGYGQLDWKLRNKPEVVVMERTNARYLKPELFKEQADFITIDVSFISTALILPVLLPLLKANGQVVLLIKPQFEAGKKKVNKGVITDLKTHVEVISKVIEKAEEVGFASLALDYSPIKGPKGNIEFLLLLDTLGKQQITEATIRNIVAKAHKME